MHVGQLQGIDRACKSTPLSKASKPPSPLPLSTHPHLNMIMYICIYLRMKSEARCGKFVCNWTVV